MQTSSGDTPEPPSDRPAGAPDDASRKDARRRYKAQHWQSYKARRPRVTITLTAEEYAEAAKSARAAGRSVPQQIWRESRAYREQQFLPSRQIEDAINALTIAIRRIGDAVAEIAQDRGLFTRVKGGAKLLERVQAVEETVAAFVSRPWRGER